MGRHDSTDLESYRNRLLILPESSTLRSFYFKYVLYISVDTVSFFRYCIDSIQLRIWLVLMSCDAGNKMLTEAFLVSF